MRRFAIFLVLVASCVAGLGFYRGWFHVDSNADDDKRNVTFTADSTKIKEDEKKVVDKVQDLGHRVKDKAAPPNEKSKDQTAVPSVPSQSQE
jgi:outer membrane protein OmpA-like peptidoglycan-associated protein